MASNRPPIAIGPQKAITIYGVSFDLDGVPTVGSGTPLYGQWTSISPKITQTWTEFAIGSLLQTVRLGTAISAAVTIEGVLFSGGAASGTGVVLAANANGLQKMFGTSAALKIVIAGNMSSAGVSAGAINTETYYMGFEDFSHTVEKDKVTFVANCVSLGLQDGSGNNIDWAWTTA